MAIAKPKSGRSIVYILPFLAILAGVGVGAATTLTTYRDPILNLPGHEVTANSKPSPVTDAKPRVAIPAPATYDFGVMARGEEQSHSFKIQNIGSGPLTLKVLDTTCKCTVGDLGKDTVKSGETVDVTLTWVARSYDREFRQSATIETNDQSQREVIFEVFGEVKQLALPDLPLVTYSRVSRSDPQQFVTNVYAYRDTDLVITSHDFSEEDLAEFFTVTTAPLPREEWSQPDATSATKVTVDIKPGLPLGIVRQIISLNTNKSDIAPMDIAVDMTVVSDISVIGGHEFNDETNVLRLGPVPRGKEYKLNLLVKGQYKDIVQFTVHEIDPPDVLQAELGEAREISKGKTILVPLKILVKEDSPVVQRMGSKQSPLGRIIFKTQHPEIDQFDIKVQFAVQ